MNSPQPLENLKKIIVIIALPGFEPGSPGSEPEMLDRCTKGLFIQSKVKTKLYKSFFLFIITMKRSSRRWKKKNQMRWKWQRKILKRVKRKRKQRRGK